MVTPEPVGVGSAFRVVATIAGRKVPLRYEVTEFDRPYRVTVRAENGSTISEDTITFTPADRRAEDHDGEDRERRPPHRGALRRRSAAQGTVPRARTGARAHVRAHR